MKKIFKRVVALGGALMLSLGAFAGCGGKDPNKNKATLHVFSFTSGFGKEWFTSLIADYEEKMKDVEIDGKKGIHIEPMADKTTFTGPKMKTAPQVVYFLEQQDYYELIAGNYIADITSAVTSVNPYDGKTLESKMYDDQKSYFARQVDGETRYYAYPHYFTSFGIVYDIDLFDGKGYYFADGYDKNGALIDMFVGNQGWEKTAGPDGQKNTSDDGLPTTYEEFFLLCDYIAEIGNDNPLIWAGTPKDSYLTHFINALATDYEGYEQMRLNFTFDGEAKTLGKAVGNTFVQDTETTVIDGTNGAELARQAGKYYAMDFYQTLYNKSYIKDKETTLFSSTYSHLKAQEDFLKRGTTRNAMLLDGSWWQMEADKTFKDMAKINSAYSKENRKLGWMPLPKQSADKVDGTSTAYDIMYPLCVMKSGLDVNSWEYKYALDFIQFANSDEQLAKFTQITGCTKALQYDLSETQYNSLTPFAKSFYDSYKKSDIVFPYDNNLVFANNQGVFKEIASDNNGSPLYKSTTPGTYFVLALENGKTLESYFNGMYDYFKDLTIWKKAK